MKSSVLLKDEYNCAETKQPEKAIGPSVLFLNLPHEQQIMRRYMCSSLAPNYLFPPQELIALAGIIKDFKKKEAFLLDCIAEKLDMEKTIKTIAKISPGVIVTICGFEIIEKDLEKINVIKTIYPNTPVVLFGHYPTQFPSEILENSHVDYIILGEPDLIFSELYDVLAGLKPADEVQGIAFRNKNGTITLNSAIQRITNPNKLPAPAYELLKIEHYNEPFMPQPFGMIQSARGCPYQCNYCVKSFGTKLTLLTPERMMEEVAYLHEKFQIRSLRFIDDTFTAVPKRVIEFCKLLIESNIKIQWTCLSRVDTINDEMLKWMRKAGCKRIYFGVESGSEKVLRYLNKEVDLNEAQRNLLLCRKNKIETAGFFMLGYPIEDNEDLKKSIEFAKKSKLSFIAVALITPYPGTVLYAKLKDQINFSLLPYKNEFKDPNILDTYLKNETFFFRKFYLRPMYLKDNFLVLMSNAPELIKIFASILYFILKNRKIHAFKYMRSK